MPSQFDPPSGTRDLLAADVERREHAFAVIRSVFTRYGFEPLQTPAFERLDVLLGKYGEESDKLVFKILRRGEHEATGEADLALRYDMTVPLARVAAAYGSQLPTPYKRYAMGLVWRADRPGKDRYREFVQCDLDTLGSLSLLADAETLSAQHDALAELGLQDFTVLLNSRRVLAGLLGAFGIGADKGAGVLTSLDKLDKLPAGEVVAELTGRGLPVEQACELVTTLTAPDSVERVRVALTKTDEGTAGLDEVDTVLSLLGGQVPAGRVVFTPRMVRGLSYYTGPIWEVVAAGVAGSIGSGGRYDNLIAQLGGPDVPATGASLGVERVLALLPGPETDQLRRLDVAVTVMRPDLAMQSFALAAAARRASLRASVYLGSSSKLGRQLKWASDSGARWAVIYGEREHEAGVTTVRDMRSGVQTQVPTADLGDFLVRAARADS
ncbi:MAG TPA: histidine--tRNA ligase [Streptosporangiaceae bacterium]|nr:histidine--tRNA ligase [Streptosporangiaceae bacterium]